MTAPPTPTRVPTWRYANAHRQAVLGGGRAGCGAEQAAVTYPGAQNLCGGERNHERFPATTWDGGIHAARQPFAVGVQRVSADRILTARDLPDPATVGGVGGCDIR